MVFAKLGFWNTRKLRMKPENAFIFYYHNMPIEHAVFFLVSFFFPSSFFPSFFLLLLFPPLFSFLFLFLFSFSFSFSFSFLFFLYFSLSFSFLSLLFFLFLFSFHLSFFSLPPFLFFLLFLPPFFFFFFFFFFFCTAFPSEVVTRVGRQPVSMQLVRGLPLRGCRPRVTATISCCSGGSGSERCPKTTSKSSPEPRCLQETTKIEQSTSVRLGIVFVTQYPHPSPRLALGTRAVSPGGQYQASSR